MRPWLLLLLTLLVSSGCATRLVAHGDDILPDVSNPVDGSRMWLGFDDSAWSCRSVESCDTCTNISQAPQAIELLLTLPGEPIARYQKWYRPGAVVRWCGPERRLASLVHACSVDELELDADGRVTNQAPCAFC